MSDSSAKSHIDEVVDYEPREPDNVSSEEMSKTQNEGDSSKDHHTHNEPKTQLVLDHHHHHVVPDFISAMDALLDDDDEEQQQQEHNRDDGRRALDDTDGMSNTDLQRDNPSGTMTVTATRPQLFATEPETTQTLCQEMCALARRLFIIAVHCATIWFVLWCILGDVMEPGGAIFDTMAAAIVSTVIGREICQRLTLPTLVGILGVGVVWSALPGDLTQGIPNKVFAVSRTLGATIILLRIGLSINVVALRRVAFSAVVLSVVPFVAETVTYLLLTGFAVTFADGVTLEVKEALVLGLAIAGSAPAVSVPALMRLHDVGKKGVHTGYITMVLTAFGFNVAMTFVVFNVCFSVSFGGDGNPGWEYGKIPVQLVMGVLMGVALGYGIQRVFGEKRGTCMRLAFLVIVVPCGFMFAGAKYDLQGGAAAAVFTFGVAFNAQMRRRHIALVCAEKDAAANTNEPIDHPDEDATTNKSVPMRHSHSSTLHDNTVFVKVMATKMWDFVVEPFLFGLVGASVVNNPNAGLSRIFDGHNFPRLLGVMFCASFVMCASTVLTMVLITGKSKKSGEENDKVEWTTGELVFASLAWIGKGAPQVALGSAMLVHQDDNDMSTESGVIALQASVLAVLFLGPLCAILVRLFGGRLIRRG